MLHILGSPLDLVAGQNTSASIRPTTGLVYDTFDGPLMRTNQKKIRTWVKCPVDRAVFGDLFLEAARAFDGTLLYICVSGDPKCSWRN